MSPPHETETGAGDLPASAPAASAPAGSNPAGSNPAGSSSPTSAPAAPSPVRSREDIDPRGRSRDRSWPPLPEPLPFPVIDNHC
ncbi:MAG: TatD family hydrolase, partial [Brachybacterium sp.]